MLPGSQGQVSTKIARGKAGEKLEMASWKGKQRRRKLAIASRLQRPGSSRQSQLHNLWCPGQNENSGPLVLKAGKCAIKSAETNLLPFGESLLICYSVLYLLCTVILSKEKL